MASKQYTSIGGLKKPHGLSGELKVFVQEDYLEDFINAKVIFIKTAGAMLPYFVENIRAGNSIIIEFEDIKSKEAALKIASKEIFLPTDKLIPQEEKQWLPEDLVYSKCVGYKMIDVTLGELGNIDRVEEYPQQEMAIITYKGKETLIPLNEHFIVEIDEATKVVKVELPEGLV